LPALPGWGGSGASLDPKFDAPGVLRCRQSSKGLPGEFLSREWLRASPT
jgi:hypothetical protein